MHCKTVENSIKTSVVKVYGITQDPETKNYMMVMQYAKNGSLRNYLDKNYDKLNWKTKLYDLLNISFGLSRIHKKELIHRDLYIGNILKFPNFVSITDMGLCKPTDYNEMENAKNSTYGVLPYVAPEILRGQNFTKAADIYSFGLRPRFSNIKVPQLIVHLIKRCLDANPLNRPKVEEIYDILYVLSFRFRDQLQKQIIKAEEINNSLPTSKSLQIDISQLIIKGNSGDICSSSIS
ncbi:hypothetical protein RclHR1_05610011 [Rhizophagus clarus]|uniref:Protein kinase domain-containing protein n=1 Tax=Rhizophagus clarus TaxID=94130 RepID=A0A2Z6RP92_9GLOM|nr:hypothetical protein RclHR1_05610011 [Rhizophagus clarus]